MPADQVKLVIFDVDGVLTDGFIEYSRGEETKRFSVKDGLGIVFLRRARIEVAFISGRRTEAVDKRAKDLDVRFVQQGVEDKLAAVRDVMHKVGVREEEVAYMGDDLPDLAVLRRVGFSCAPADAVPEVRSVCELVTKAPGGQGAAREVAERVLKAQGRWAPLVESYLT